MLSSSYLNLASSYLENKSERDFNNNIRKASELASNLKIYSDISYINYLKSKYYLLKKQYKKSIDYAEKSYEYNFTNGFLNEKKDILYLLHKIHYEIGNYQKSLSYFKEYKSLSDTLNQSNSDYLLTSISSSIDAENKIKELKIENELFKSKSEKQLLFIFILLACVFGIIVIASVYYVYNRRLKITNKILNEKLELIEDVHNKLIKDISSSMITHTMEVVKYTNKDFRHKMHKTLDVLTDQYNELIIKTKN
jgi:tetratricopeptide (TPR) repeat protein